MSPTTSPTSSSGAATQGTASNTTPSPMVDKNMFMQLLVAQLKNQDPLNPTDGTQFVTQLAQFQQLEQSVNSGQDISAIRNAVDAYLAQSSATSSPTQS